MQKKMKFNIDHFAKMKGVSGQAARYHLRNYSKRTATGNGYGWNSQDEMRRDWAEIEKKKGAKVGPSARAKPHTSVKGRTRVAVKAKGKATPAKTKPVAKKTAPAKAAKKSPNKAATKASKPKSPAKPPLPADVSAGFGEQPTLAPVNE